ncbi:MAG: hypothetical protein JJE52_14275 [Acidimicrobiia bacterium]|nr:hypothetical protein [Acidimicrobiia bacterium]
MSTSSSAATAASAAATVTPPRRGVLRGARATGVDRHAFEVVANLPRLSLSRPTDTGDRTADALRDAAWNEGEALGHAEGHARGYAEGFEAARAAGSAEGHAEGLETGRELAASEHQAVVGPALQALEQASAGLVARNAVALVDIESGVVELALALAATILDREIAVAVDPGGDAIRRALRLAPERGEILVRLNPADIDGLGDTASLAPGRDLEIVADPSVGRGGCLVETDASRVDARIETALDRARTALGTTSGERRQTVVES